MRIDDSFFSAEQKVLPGRYPPFNRSKPPIEEDFSIGSELAKVGVPIQDLIPPPTSKLRCAFMKFDDLGRESGYCMSRKNPDSKYCDSHLRSEARSLILNNQKKAVETMLRLMNDAKLPANVRAKIAFEILDRGGNSTVQIVKLLGESETEAPWTAVAATATRIEGGSREASRARRGVGAAVEAEPVDAEVVSEVSEVSVSAEPGNPRCEGCRLEFEDLPAGRKAFPRRCRACRKPPRRHHPN